MLNTTQTTIELRRFDTFCSTETLESSFTIERIFFLFMSVDQEMFLISFDFMKASR